jgi:hypothetical protein
MKHLLIALLLSSPALAQTAKTPIEIGCQSKTGDGVGTELCTAIRDGVATSPRYQEVDSSPQGFQLRVITVAISENGATAASVILTYNDYYISSLVQTCGSDRVGQCARGLVASFDEDITAFEKEVLATARASR